MHHSKIAFLPALILGLVLPATLLAAEPLQVVDQALVESLVQRVKTLENELQQVRQQVPETSSQSNAPCYEFVSASSDFYGPHQKSDLAGPAGYNHACHCNCNCQGCYSCQMPLAPAPCIDCPRVSTLRPYNSLHIFGAMKLDMIFSEPRPFSPGTPFFLSTGSVPGRDQNIVSIHGRQSTLAAAFVGPEFFGLQSGGTIITLFFNDSVIADQYGILPLQAFGELKNENWRFAAGLQFDVFSPGIPTVLPFSALAASGNAGNSFRGQIRLERFLHLADNIQWTLQAALSEPINSTISREFRVSEDNGWPNLEARIALGLGYIEGVGLTARRPFEIGFSGVVGQLRTTDVNQQIVADVWGLSTDFRWKMTDRFGLAGEIYTGQTLGTYNGGILQTINLDTFNGIRSSGGWIETFYYLTPCLHSHVGWGLDDPIDRDIDDIVGSLGRTYNSTFFANLLWDVNQVFRVGFEFTWRQTNYRLLPDNDGPAFHTQFQWAF